MRHIAAGPLSVSYHDLGPQNGPQAVLLHGFPYDDRACLPAAQILAAEGWRVIVPQLRGYGDTRFLSADTPRSGEQAALGQDLRDLIAALDLSRPVVAGYDWGGRAACVVAALWPETVRGLVSCGAGYNIQDIARASEPAPPEMEARYWYQYYLHGARGAAGLAANREAFTRLLWQMWSPSWRFTETEFAASAASFQNPDFVAVVLHSYRHRFGLVPGDPACTETEAALARQPVIPVPTVVLHGQDDGVDPPGANPRRDRFTGPYRHELLPGIGHNLPQEAPLAFARAVMSLA